MVYLPRFSHFFKFRSLDREMTGKCFHTGLGPQAGKLQASVVGSLEGGCWKEIKCTVLVYIGSSSVWPHLHPKPVRKYLD